MLKTQSSEEDSRSKAVHQSEAQNLKRTRKSQNLNSKHAATRNGRRAEKEEENHPPSIWCSYDPNPSSPSWECHPTLHPPRLLRGSCIIRALIRRIPTAAFRSPKEMLCSQRARPESRITAFVPENQHQEGRGREGDHHRSTAPSHTESTTVSQSSARRTVAFVHPRCLISNSVRSEM